METRIMEDKKKDSLSGIHEIMDEFDIKILGIEEDKLRELPLYIDVPTEGELLRNPYAE